MLGPLGPSNKKPPLLSLGESGGSMSHSDKFYDYPDDERWVLPVDSGGMYSPKKFIKKGSMPVKERVIERLQEDIDDLEYTLKSKKKDLERVRNGEIDLRYV